MNLHGGELEHSQYKELAAFYTACIYNNLATARNNLATARMPMREEAAHQYLIVGGEWVCLQNGENVITSPLLRGVLYIASPPSLPRERVIYANNEKQHL